MTRTNLKNINFLGLEEHLMYFTSKVEHFLTLPSCGNLYSWRPVLITSVGEHRRNKKKTMNKGEIIENRKPRARVSVLFRWDEKTQVDMTHKEKKLRRQ